MKIISWNVSVKDHRTIVKIVDRAMSLAAEAGVSYDRRDALMDLTACHANGNPLDLSDLLTADDFDFAHDVFGIRRHIDRRTGELKDCFNPRYAAKAS